MKEYLEQTRQLYMDLWAFHLESLLKYQKSGDPENTLKQASDRSMELGRKYKGTCIEEFACQMAVAAVDEIERIVKIRPKHKNYLERGNPQPVTIDSADSGCRGRRQRKGAEYAKENSKNYN